MNLPTEIFGNVAVVHAPEELGGDQVAAFHTFFGGLAQAAVVLDLDGNELLDSEGLTALVDEQERAAHRPRRFENLDSQSDQSKNSSSRVWISNSKFSKTSSTR